MAWAIDAGEPEIALELGAALWRFWVSEGTLREGRGWLERALAAGGNVSPATRAKALHFLGNLALDLGDYPRARTPYEASLAIRRTLGDQNGIAASLNGLGIVACEEGDYTSARQLHEESLAIRREVGNRYGEALSLHNLGHTSTESGDLVAARTYHEAALVIQRREQEVVGIAYSLWGLGEAARREQKSGQALDLLAEALSQFRNVDDQLGVASALHGLAHVAGTGGDVPLAAERFAEPLALRRDLGERRGVIECLEGLASLAANQEKAELAARWWSAAAAERHFRHMPLPAVDRENHERALANTRSNLGKVAFSASWAAGAYKTFDAAVAEALAFASSIREPEPPQDDFGLSPREREVLRLLAEGQTNQEIADALLISPRTVTSHVTNILGKLGVPSRTAAVTVALRSGLV